MRLWGPACIIPLLFWIHITMCSSPLQEATGDQLHSALFPAPFPMLPWFLSVQASCPESCQDRHKPLVVRVRLCVFGHYISYVSCHCGEMSLLREGRVCFEGIVMAGKTRAAETSGLWSHGIHGRKQRKVSVVFHSPLFLPPGAPAHWMVPFNMGLPHPVKLLWRHPDRHTEDCFYGNSKSR